MEPGSENRAVALAQRNPSSAERAVVPTVTPTVNAMIADTAAGSVRTAQVRRQTKKDMDEDVTCIKQYVKNSLFPKNKFIWGEGSMEFDVSNRNSICFQCLCYCNMVHDENRISFWKNAVPVIYADIKARRNSVQGDMKDAFMGGCAIWSEGGCVMCAINKHWCMLTH